MKKFRAWAGAVATTSWEFEVREDEIPSDPEDVRDFLEEAAYNQGGYASLCHQCGKHLDISDFEIGDGPDDIEEVN